MKWYIRNQLLIMVFVWLAIAVAALILGDQTGALIVIVASVINSVGHTVLLEIRKKATAKSVTNLSVGRVTTATELREAIDRVTRRATDGRL